MLIHSRDEVAKHLGEVVILQGEVTNSKQAMLLGVDVESSSPDLRGQEAWAAGRLEKYQVDDPMKDGVIRQGRAAGTYVRLVAPLNGGLAHVRDGAMPAEALQTLERR